MTFPFKTLWPSVALLLSLPLGCGTEFVDCHKTGSCPTTGSAGEAGAPGVGGDGGGGTSTTGSGGSTASTNGGAGGSGGTTATSSGGTAGTTATTTTSGGAGGTGPVPCDGECGGSTPVCDPETDTCVGCLDSATDCEAPTAVCDPETQRCVECAGTEGCNSDAVCNPASHQCVECLGPENCADPTPLCDTEAQLCAECLENADCPSTQESLCDGGSCSPCQSNQDCAHLSATPVCDTVAAECVECTPENEAVCGGTSCNPETRTCTQTELGTVDDCQPCTADSECIGNDLAEPLRRCVPMEFNGEPRDKAYCLVRRSQVSQCARPFVVGVTAPSRSGAPEELYCGIGQENVTCEAVVDFLDGRECPGGQDSECGCPRDGDAQCTAPGQGGFCRNFPTVNNRCTYECNVAAECSTQTCANQDPDFCQ